MSLTVQTIVNSCSQDIRSVLGTSGTDAAKITDWIDRIHKDCLHSSVYSYLNYATTTIATVSGTASYNLTPTNIRRILTVFDQSRQRIIFPIERATNPVSQHEKSEPAPGQTPPTYAQPPLQPLQLQWGQSAYYRHLGGQTLLLYPTPTQAVTISVDFEKQVVSLVNLTDILVVPEDGRDMIVAGTNYLANLMLKRAEEAQFWLAIYEKLKRGESLI